MRMRRILDDFLSVACNLCCHLFGYLLKVSRLRVSIRWFSRRSKVLDRDTVLPLAELCVIDVEGYFNDFVVGGFSEVREQV